MGATSAFERPCWGRSWCSLWGTKRMKTMPNYSRRLCANAPSGAVIVAPLWGSKRAMGVPTARAVSMRTPPLELQLKLPMGYCRGVCGDRRGDFMRTPPLGPQLGLLVRKETSEGSAEMDAREARAATATAAAGTAAAALATGGAAATTASGWHRLQ